MNDGLDSANLTPAASLNRVRFTALSGLQIPAGMVDWAAYALLSARALADLTKRYGNADEAARNFGGRLGWLLVTLRLGDPASRAVRPDWDDSYWHHWASITTVYLGGGVVSGDLGPRIAEHASQLLASSGMSACRVQVAPWPEHLPLVGAARACSETPPAVVLDFGHSFVKRARVTWTGGALTSLRLLPRLPARWTKTPPGGEPSAEQTRCLGAFMVDALAESWLAAQALDATTSTTVAASLASYLRDGQPLARQGGAYAALLSLSDNLADWLSLQLSTRLGHQIAVQLLHDGTAAAHALAGAEHAAVITMGTSLGVGFPPAADSCRSISSAFTIGEPAVGG